MAPADFSVCGRKKDAVTKRYWCPATKAQHSGERWQLGWTNTGSLLTALYNLWWLMKLGICSNCNSSIWKIYNHHHRNLELALFLLSTGKLKRSFLLSQVLRFPSSPNLKPCVWEDTQAHWGSIDQIHYGVRILLNRSTGLVTWKRKTKQQTVFLGIANAPKRRYAVTSVLRKDTCSLTRQTIL